MRIERIVYMCCNTEILEKRLEDRGIRPTAIRILILKEMLAIPQAFSLMDLEERCDTIDKSTIFRTLTLFHNKMMIHSIDDGSGSMKYSLCAANCTCSGSASHVHFSCHICNKTYCLTNIAIPKLNLPAGFEYEDANFVLKGICKNCTENNH